MRLGLNCNNCSEQLPEQEGLQPWGQGAHVSSVFWRQLKYAFAVIKHMLKYKHLLQNILTHLQLYSILTSVIEYLPDHFWLASL